MSTETERIDADDLAVECLNLHYDRFDTLGMEESSLPDDIARAGAVYEARDVPLAAIPGLDDPDVDIDDEKVDEYAKRLQAGADAPRVVLDSDLGLIDGWHRALAAQQAGRTAVAAWVARIVTKG